MSFSQLEFLGIRKEDLSTSDTVSSGGGTDAIEVTINGGECIQIVGIVATIPAIGGASGNHSLTVKSGGTDIVYCDIVGTDGAAMYITKSGLSADTENPSDAGAQQNIINHNIWGYDDGPVTFVYKNNSDTNQTGNRILYVLMKVYRQVI